VKKIMRCTALLIVLMGGFTAASSAQPSFVRVGSISWLPITENGGHFFPSFALATATMNTTIQGTPRLLGEATPLPVNRVAPVYRGDSYGYFGVALRSARVPLHVRVQIDAPALAETSSIEADLTDSTRMYELFPQMLYKDQNLQGMTQLTTATVGFKVFVNDSLVSEQRQLVRVRSVNDVPFMVDFRLGGRVDQSWMFSAYVNENHPAIDELLRAALQSGTVRSFIGYQGSPQDVYQQVFALWNVFQLRGIRYSSITTPSAEGTGVYAQNVRDLSESLRSSQANCVDGTVLFASVLRKIGIDPVLIKKPGHMYLGFYLDARHSGFAALETTMLGHTDIAQLPRDGTAAAALSQAFGGPTRNTASWNSFLNAYNFAMQSYAADETPLRQGQSGYALIDIARMRRLGVAPVSK
jgi:hypothetical protein